jgi:hypothetical protein
MLIEDDLFRAPGALKSSAEAAGLRRPSVGSPSRRLGQRAEHVQDKGDHYHRAPCLSYRVGHFMLAERGICGGAD